MKRSQQAELVDEYVEHHRKLFALRMERAHAALLGGKKPTLAYSLGIDETDVERVGGVSSDLLGGSCKPRRATSNHASSPEGRAVGVTPTSYTIEGNAKQASTNRCDGRPGAGGRA